MAFGEASGGMTESAPRLGPMPDSTAGRLLAGVKVASIGPITSETARACGIEVTAQARVFTVDGLVEAVLEMFASESA